MIIIYKFTKMNTQLNTQLKGKYKKNDYNQKTSFFNSPTTSSQDIVCTRTNDTSSDISYPTNRYVSVRNLGEGSASTIFEGIDNYTNQKVIIKKISKNECWRKELEVLKRLQSSTSGLILKYVDFYESQRNSFIITEFYKGFDLFEHIDLNVPYSKQKGLKLMYEMARCIKECHDDKIVHLDIKCENYMVKSNHLFEGNDLSGQIVLIDFGHAEIYKPNEQIEKIKRGYNYGTSYYLCPEGYYDRIFSSKSDIWSLGICLALLVTGDFPFLGNKKEYYRNSLIENVCLSNNIDEDCANLIRDCLRIHPYNRPNIDQFIAKIKYILNE